MATFDAGCEAPHRSHFEIVGEKGVIKVEDLVGGQGRTGDFSAYEGPFTGSTQYTQGDVMGKDEIIFCEPNDHARQLVCTFNNILRKMEAGQEHDGAEWSRRTLAVHTVMCKLFESSENGGTMEEL